MDATAATDGPPGYPGEPYIPLAVSFAMRSGERRRQGHLDYALSRSFWAEQRPPMPTEEDGETLRRLVHERLPHDLRVIDAGGDPEALRTNRRNSCPRNPGASRLPPAPRGAEPDAGVFLRP